MTYHIGIRLVVESDGEHSDDQNVDDEGAEESGP